MAHKDVVASIAAVGVVLCETEHAAMAHDGRLVDGPPTGVLADPDVIVKRYTLVREGSGYGRFIEG